MIPRAGVAQCIIEEQLNRESDPGYAVVTHLARNALQRRKG
jgi:hypothetical protein